VTWPYLLSAGLTLSTVLGAYLWRSRLVRDKQQEARENRQLLETEVRNRTAELQREITERKRAEGELAKSLSVLHATLQSTADGILVVDREGRVTEFNRKFAEMWRLPAEVLQTRDDQRLLECVLSQFKEPETFLRKVKELYAQPEAESFDVLEFADGRVFERYSQPHRVADAVVGRVFCFRDVTARQRAEADLRWKSALLEAQLDSYSVGVLVVDCAGKKILQNRRTIDLWKIPKEIVDNNDDKTQVQFVLNRTTNPDQFVEKIVYLYSHPSECSADEIELVDGTILERYSAPVVGKDGTHYGRIWTFIDITERKRAEAALYQANRDLVEMSRQAGMAEVATGVLHNVGNVLNSVTVSAAVVADQVGRSKAANIGKVAALLDEHKAGLASFLTDDPRGQKLPSYLATLGAMLVEEQQAVIAEIDGLRKNVEHINGIIAMQQSFARTLGVIETLSASDLIEDALRIDVDSLDRHGIALVRDFQASPLVTTDKHKVIQVLVNLLRNAKQACDASGRADPQITVRTTTDEHGVNIAVIDNGIGIPAENLTRIFNHGFTTRKDGHGFGLHSGALAAKAIGGELSVHSDGAGRGATFTLKLPFAMGPSAVENSAA
jgi:PAS domain S-box-containing protein